MRGYIGKGKLFTTARETQLERLRSTGKVMVGVEEIKVKVEVGITKMNVNVPVLGGMLVR